MDIVIFTLNGFYIGCTYGNSEFINKFAVNYIAKYQEESDEIEYWNNGIKKQKKSIPILKQSFSTLHSSIPTFQSFKNITNLFLNQFPVILTVSQSDRSSEKWDGPKRGGR